MTPLETGGPSPEDIGVLKSEQEAKKLADMTMEELQAEASKIDHDTEEKEFFGGLRTGDKKTDSKLDKPGGSLGKVEFWKAKDPSQQHRLNEIQQQINLKKIQADIEKKQKGF